jgi:hypothetical protein
MPEKALRNKKGKIVLGACHGDIDQAALLLDLGGRPGRRSDGMRPSTTLRTKRDFHSWTLAELIVERIRQLSSGTLAWSLVASGGSSVSSVKNRSSGGIVDCDLLELDQIGVTCASRPALQSANASAICE